MSTPLQTLKHHVTGAIERGEKEAIVEQTLALPQGTLLWPREPFTAKVGRSTIKAYPSQSFWVTSTRLIQQQSGMAIIARSGQKTGWAFLLADMHKFFTTGQPA